MHIVVIDRAVTYLSVATASKSKILRGHAAPVFIRKSHFTRTSAFTRVRSFGMLKETQSSHKFCRQPQRHRRRYLDPDAVAASCKSTEFPSEGQVEIVKGGLR